MDLLRLIAVAVAAAACAACGQAGAQSPPVPAATSGLTAPAAWSALPELAAAVEGAVASADVSVEGTEAWGEPARGCYAVWLSLRADRATAGQVVRGLSGHGITTTEVVAPTADDGELTARFERAPFRGRLRARVEGGKIVAIACFANEREPASCEAGCTALLGGLR